MNAPSATPKPASAGKPATTSLADQIAAAKVQGSKPTAAGTKAPAKTPDKSPDKSPGKSPDGKGAKWAESSEPAGGAMGKIEELRKSLVAELVELYKDRTSRIVLFGAAGTLAVAIAGGAVWYSKSADTAKKKSAPVPALVSDAPTSKAPPLAADSMTPAEIRGAHRQIIDDSPSAEPKRELPKGQTSNLSDRGAVPAVPESKEPQPEKAIPKPPVAESLPDADRVREKKEEIARTGGATIRGPQDVSAIIEAIRNNNERDGAAPVKPTSKR